MTYRLAVSQVGEGWAISLWRADNDATPVDAPGSVAIIGTWHECLRELTKTLEVIEQPKRKRSVAHGEV